MPYLEFPVPKSKHPTQEGELSDIGELPFGLDPQRFPIIAAHWFGVSPVAVAVAVGVEAVAQAV